ncbi:hypothetical protein Tco_1081033 [Tanacetum coccineum]|uniref:Reverse transcriptase domain-containing protein n=1 Tax=Tanacetum coccineum TaxID=301880 RepID=A0ABQ5HWH3_9ASTR
MSPRVEYKKKSVRKIVEKRVAKAIEKYEKTKADSNNAGGSGSTNTGGTAGRAARIGESNKRKWEEHQRNNNNKNPKTATTSHNNTHNQDRNLNNKFLSPANKTREPETVRAYAAAPTGHMEKDCRVRLQGAVLSNPDDPNDLLRLIVKHQNRFMGAVLKQRSKGASYASRQGERGADALDQERKPQAKTSTCYEYSIHFGIKTKIFGSAKSESYQDLKAPTEWLRGE